MSKLVSLAACIVGLSGCSMGVYDGHFDCAPDKGLGCHSVTQVNELVNRGQAGRSSIESLNSPCSREDKSCSEGLKNLPPFKLKRIWVAPNDETKAGHYITIDQAEPGPIVREVSFIKEGVSSHQADQAEPGLIESDSEREGSDV